MSSPEIFTAIDFAKKYKILIVLYNSSGISSSVSANALLHSSHCFLNHRDHVYDELLSENFNKHHRNKIAQNIQRGLSPIIIDNVIDLTSPPVKAYCEYAVKFGYLIDIIHDNQATSLITREDLYIKFQLCYDQEIPQLREYPSIPGHLKRVDDTAMKEVIQRRYGPWIVAKQATTKNEEEEDKNVSLPDETKDFPFVDETPPTSTVRGKLKKDLPEQEKLYKDVTSNVQTSTSSPNDAKNYAQQHKNEVETGNMTKEKLYMEAMAKYRSTVSPNNAKTFTQQHTDDVETGNMTKKQEKVYTEALANCHRSTVNANNVKSFEQMLKNDVEVANSSKEADIPKETNQQEILQALQEDINKRFEENEENISKTIEDSFAEMRDYNKTQSITLCTRLDQQLKSFMESTQGVINKKLEENNKAIAKKMENFLTEIKKFIQTEVETLSTHVNEQFASKVAASQALISKDENEAVGEKAKKSTDKSSNKKAEAQGAKKRTPQTQEAAPQENPADDTAYEQIIAYIREGFKVMILLRGLPGCGKSYMANKLLQDSHGTVNRSEFIFNPLEHLMRKTRFKDGDSEAAHTLNKRKCFEAVTRGVSPVIVDSTNLQIEDMRVYCLMAIENGYMIETIEVNTPWASNISELAKKNTLKLDRKQIQMMQECYQRNVSSSCLLKELGINYKQSLPQFRTYPPFIKPEIAKKPVEVAKKPPTEYVHKFDMKHGEKTEQTANLVDVSDANENITVNNVNKEIKRNKNVEDIDDMRKKLTEQSSFIQQLLTYIPMFRTNQINVSSMQQIMPQDSGYDQAPQSRNYPSTYEDQQDFDPYSTNRSSPSQVVAFNSHTNPNVGNTTGNYQTSSDGFGSIKEATKMKTRKQSDDPWKNFK